MTRNGRYNELPIEREALYRDRHRIRKTYGAPSPVLNAVHLAPLVTTNAVLSLLVMALDTDSCRPTGRGQCHHVRHGIPSRTKDSTSIYVDTPLLRWRTYTFDNPSLVCLCCIT